MSKRIFYDGVNLSLRRGTGIATYTRVLAQTARELGYGTGILYSRPYKLPSEELLREVVFFDADRSTRGNSIGKRGSSKTNAAPATKDVFSSVLSMRQFFPSIRNVRPQEVVLSDRVVKKPLGASWVPSDEVYSAPYVFSRSRAQFMFTGHFLKVDFERRPDIFHWTYPLPALSNARANIYAIHDLIPLRLPYTGLEWKKFFYRSVKTMAAKADHIVTVSESSKRDIMEFFGVEESRITNTYAATDMPNYYVTRSEDAIANELGGMFGLEMRNYLLYYGSLEPKKNVGRIVEAYLAANVSIPLVIVFAQSWLADRETEFLEQILASPMGDKRIHTYEYLPFRFLATLIAGARAVLFPSLYEGFGLPLLEGMMLGTPVISSNTSSMPEVAGDAALLVDPHDVDGIKGAIQSVCHDRDLCADLRQRGLKRAEMFSLEAYRECVGKLYAALS